MISAAFAVIEDEEQRNELSDFYIRNRRRLFGIAYSFLKNANNAEDAVQETFLRISKYPKRFFDMEYDKRISYAVVVLKNAVSDMARPPGADFEELTDDIADDTPSIEDMAVGKIGSEKLKAFILELPESQRRALQLKITYGMSNGMIANVLGITNEAARKRISDGCKKIKKFLEGENADG